jgi:hypothetical protein
MPALFLLGTYQDSSTTDDTTHIKGPACVIPRAVARGPLPLRVISAREAAFSDDFIKADPSLRLG